MPGGGAALPGQPRGCTGTGSKPGALWAGVCFAGATTPAEHGVHQQVSITGESELVAEANWSKPCPAWLGLQAQVP